MKRSFKSILGRGLTLAIPLGVVIYVCIKLFYAFQGLISPIAAKLGLNLPLGGLLLTIFTVFLLIVLMFILGLLMQLSFIAGIGRSMESTVTRFIPSLNQLKLMAAEKLELENATNTWKPVMVLLDTAYYPAFVIEESEELITLYVIKGTNIDAGEMLITAKSNVKMVPIQASDMRLFSKQYGLGYLELIKKNALAFNQ